MARQKGKCPLLYRKAMFLWGQPKVEEAARLYPEKEYIK